MSKHEPTVAVYWPELPHTRSLISIKIGLWMPPLPKLVSPKHGSEAGCDAGSQAGSYEDFQVGSELGCQASSLPGSQVASEVATQDALNNCVSTSADYWLSRLVEDC